MKQEGSLFYRQGDLLLKKISRLPQGERKLRPDGILLYGEVTGHSHALEQCDQAELFDAGDDCYLRVSSDGVRIVHPEHAPISLPKGNYVRIPQREYTPQEIVPVRD